MARIPPRRIATDDRRSLPLHLLLMDEMTRPASYTRLCESRSAHSMQYECETFYKPISRPFRAAAAAPAPAGGE